MRRVLVTGAAGAFGPSVVRQFEKNQENVVYRTDCRGQDSDKSISCDLRIRSHVENLLAKVQPDLVIHLAGTLSSDFDEALAVNVNAARMLLETIEKNKSRARIILIGSAAEYGVVDPAENPLKETRQTSPVSIYGLTKAWQTLLMNVFVQRGVDVVAARMFNLDGPGLSDRLIIGRVQKMIQAYKKGGLDRIKLGPLSAIRDFVSFESAASQIEAIALHGISGNIYHVASGEPILMRDMVQRHLAQHGLDMSCVEEGLVYTNRTGYDVPVIFADISKTKQLLSMS